MFFSSTGISVLLHSFTDMQRVTFCQQLSNEFGGIFKVESFTPYHYFSVNLRLS